MGWWNDDDGLTLGDDPCLALGQRLASARDAWLAEGRALPSLTGWLAAARDALRAQGHDWCENAPSAGLELVAALAHPDGTPKGTVTTAGIAAEPELVGAVAMALDAASFAYEDGIDRKPTTRELVSTLQIELARGEDYVDLDEPFDLERLVATPA